MTVLHNIIIIGLYKINVLRAVQFILRVRETAGHSSDRQTVDSDDPARGKKNITRKKTIGDAAMDGEKSILFE